MVVAEPGRLGTPALLAIGDADGGLVVRGASGLGSLGRGTRLEVAGKLAAPYGQLEIRPTEADVRILGTAALPTPRSLGAAALVESDEGHLVTATGRLDAKPTKSAAGDITLTLIRDGGAPVKVMADVTSRLTLGAFKVGATYRIVGFVGQRATRTGALDGYRIWIRDAADLVLVGAPSGSSASGVSESDRERRVDPDGDHREGSPDHRPRDRHRRRRHGPGDAPRCIGPPDRRPGRVGGGRAPAADRGSGALGGQPDPRRRPHRAGLRRPAAPGGSARCGRHGRDAVGARAPRRAQRGERMAACLRSTGASRASTSSAIGGARRSTSDRPRWSSSANPDRASPARRSSRAGSRR